MPADYSEHQKISQKPNYLISLTQKNKDLFFITLDKPDIGPSVVSVKGFFSSLELSEITESYREIVNSTLANKKEDIIEIIFPISKINFIRSLVFKSK